MVVNGVEASWSEFQTHEALRACRSGLEGAEASAMEFRREISRLKSECKHRVTKAEVTNHHGDGWEVCQICGEHLKFLGCIGPEEGETDD